MAEFLVRWERERPEREVLRFGDQSWTWTTWGERIRRNAGAQLALGPRPGEGVAFLDKNHPASLETTMACALTGTVAALLNFRLAAEEYVYLLNDCGARPLFVGQEFAGLIDSIRDRLDSLERVQVPGRRASARRAAPQPHREGPQDRAAQAGAGQLTARWPRLAVEE